MNSRTQGWSNEQDPISSHACACCGRPVYITSGILYDEKGEEQAMYVGNMSPDANPRVVILYLIFKDKERGRKRDRIVSLGLHLHEGQVATGVATDPNNPLGPALTREQVLANPRLKELIFGLDDLITATDHRIRTFLDGGDLAGESAKAS